MIRHIRDRPARNGVGRGLADTRAVLM